jgi:hypothetical protein
MEAAPEDVVLFEDIARSVIAGRGVPAVALLATLVLQ